MPENHYSVTLRRAQRVLTLSVVTEGKAGPAIVLKQAIQQGIEHMNEIGIQAEEQEFSLLSIEDCGVWPEF
ncbi:MAG: hypothetical protein K6T85_07755 [Gorillibacterium sp.]|nr:hypothetical protein [Gorillibacterium sp.]